MKHISYFLIFILFYHILITGLGGFGIETTAFVAGGKEFVWIGIVIRILGVGIQSKIRNKTLRIPNDVRLAIIGLGVLGSIGVGYSYFLGVDINQILVGFKYSLRPLVILLGSVGIGLFGKDLSDNHGLLSIEMIGKVVLGVIVVGFVWQGVKVLMPDLFMSFGYGPVGDFVVGQAAPIWYRTGPGGVMRRQGVFAGPNNYGYFLTAFAGVLGVWIAQLRSAKRKRLSGIVGVFLLAVVLTYSRGALLGVGIQMILLLWLFAPKRKKTLYWIAGIGIVGVVVLSVWKRGSTVLHFQAWFDGIDAIIANPWGYGLGSSGPSVHYTGVYLPENQYLQIALDVGVWGLVIWCGVWWVLLRGVLIKISNYWKHFCHSCKGRNPPGTAINFGNTQRNGKGMVDSVFMDPGSSPGGQYVPLIIPLLLGGVGLFVIGMFLHVLEDSMVNYWYLSLLGITMGMVLGSTTQSGTQSQ